MKKQIAIIGAGPTGIFTALFLKNCDADITLFEKNKDIGEKLKCTGGGRMNVTNKVLTADCFFSSTEREKNNFFKTQWFQKIPELLSELGIEYKWEKNRALLASGSAKIEVMRLRNMLTSQKNCTLCYNSEVVNIKKNNKKFICHINQKNKIFKKYFDIVILTTGGMFQKNYQSNKQKTYSLYESFHHFIVKPSPSLSPFRFSDLHLKKLSGVSFEGTLSDGENNITDDILITHFGISGPAVLDFSALWNKKSDIFINFLPQYSSESLLKTLQQMRNGKKNILLFFSQYLSKRLSQMLIKKSGITQLFFADITKKEMNMLIKNFTQYPIYKPELFPYQGCWTTKGGVSLRDIHLHSLESQKLSHLYIAGEVLDIDGLCGGYNISLTILQAKIMAMHILKI